MRNIAPTPGLPGGRLQVKCGVILVRQGSLFFDCWESEILLLQGFNQNLPQSMKSCVEASCVMVEWKPHVTKEWNQASGPTGGEWLTNLILLSEDLSLEDRITN